MPKPEIILDPTGANDVHPDETLAPRVVSVAGKVVALVNNGKPNGLVLLEQLASELKQHHGLSAHRSYTKDYFGTPVSEELVSRIARECDLALAAIGD